MNQRSQVLSGWSIRTYMCTKYFLRAYGGCVFHTYPYQSEYGIIPRVMCFTCLSPFFFNSFLKFSFLFLGAFFSGVSVGGGWWVSQSNALFLSIMHLI